MKRTNRRTTWRVVSGANALPALLLALLLSPWGGSARAAAQQIPPDEPGALARLNASPRHGEWVSVDAGNGDMVRAWVVFPERSTPAPVVIVIHEIFGLTDWIRSVADQLAADGFIAIAPDLLSGKAPGGRGSDGVDQQGATALIRTLDAAEVDRRLQAVARYGDALPASTDRVASIGFCWGGGTSFTLATQFPALDAAVVYYGTSPSEQAVAQVRAPILGLYAGDDARVNATIEPARVVLETLGRRFEPNTYEGAGHGFLRQQTGRDGANLRASQQAWPRTIAFLRETLGS
jgi:carboxymethylenebutenolidase